MSDILHITSGDSAATIMEKSGLLGDIFVWHDILYEGPRSPGWLDKEGVEKRVAFIEETTGGGLAHHMVLETMINQYRKLSRLPKDQHIVLWFDACLFDQSMLAHVLTCLNHQGLKNVELLCVDQFPGIEPFHGLGQLNPEQIASLYPKRKTITPAQLEFAVEVDSCFALQDQEAFERISKLEEAPLPWVPAAIARWMAECRPDPKTGLGQLESLVIKALRKGNNTPTDIFKFVAAADTPPQYWGDTTLWAKINGLATRVQPLVKIEGPQKILPQWESETPLSEFRISLSSD